MLGGAALGLVLVRATALMAPHPKAERNLAYILRQWEPAPDGTPGATARLPEGATSRAGDRRLGPR
jgi:hypothetical protein